MRDEFLPYYRPAVDEQDAAAVAEVVGRGWLTTGARAQEFEKDFAKACGIKHAVGLSSCTAGLHLGLIALGVGPGDDVVLPSLSFVAGANCIRQVGARPVFCDVDPESLCVSVETVEKALTSNTRAIMTMNYAGRPAGAAPIQALARKRGIAVLEDAALSVGMLDDGVWAGAHADVAVYSFYATKNVTTGEGGMLVTGDDEIAERVRILSLHGMDRDAWKRYTRGGTWRYDVAHTGYKYNLPDPCAVLGIRQLSKLSALQRRRDAIAAFYGVELAHIPSIKPAAIGRLRGNDRHSWCMYPVVIDEARAGVTRDRLIDDLRDMNIGTSVHYIPTHTFAAYRDIPHGPLPVTDATWPRLISLPLFPGMNEQDAQDVIDGLQMILVTRRSTAR